MATGPRPDPDQGVFETLLVLAGAPVELDAHMARLAASLEALYGEAVPAGARETVEERAGGVGLGRLRLTVRPGREGGLAVEAEAAEIEPGLPFPDGAGAVALSGALFEGGLGPHKWADRRALERLEAVAPPGAMPLLLDAGGVVLESSRANVFAVRDGRLTTPAADGRILPGIARAAAIEVARGAGLEVREAELGLDDLARADEAFLTGSVRGVEPVGSVDAARLPAAPGEATRRVASALRERRLGRLRAPGRPRA